MINSISPSPYHLSCSDSVSSTKHKKHTRQQEGPDMNLTSLITDNISEILVKIIEFTHTRQKIIIRNIIRMNKPGFVPQKLAVKEFSGLLNTAIDEHIQNKRLVLRDTENIKFGTCGNFDVKPTIDKQSKLLLEKNREEYLEVQINKLLENSLNQRVATELLRRKQNTFSTDY